MKTASTYAARRALPATTGISRTLTAGGSTTASPPFMRRLGAAWTIPVAPVATTLTPATAFARRVASTVSDARQLVGALRSPLVATDKHPARDGDRDGDAALSALSSAAAASSCSSSSSSSSSISSAFSSPISSPVSSSAAAFFSSSLSSSTITHDAVVAQACATILELTSALESAARRVRRMENTQFALLAERRELSERLSAQAIELRLARDSDSTSTWSRSDRASSASWPDDALSATERLAGPQGAFEPPIAKRDRNTLPQGDPGVVSAAPIPVIDHGDKVKIDHNDHHGHGDCLDHHGQEPYARDMIDSTNATPEKPDVYYNWVDAAEIDILEARERVLRVSHLTYLEPDHYDEVVARLHEQLAASQDGSGSGSVSGSGDDDGCHDDKTKTQQGSETIEATLDTLGLQLAETRRSPNSQFHAIIETAVQVPLQTITAIEKEASTLASTATDVRVEVEGMTAKLKRAIRASSTLNFRLEYPSEVLLEYLVDANHDHWYQHRDIENNTAVLRTYFDAIATSASDLEASSTVHSRKRGSTVTLKEACKVLGRPIHVLSPAGADGQDVVFQRWCPTDPIGSAPTSLFMTTHVDVLHDRSAWMRALLGDFEAGDVNGYGPPIILTRSGEHYGGVVVNETVGSRRAYAEEEEEERQHDQEHDHEAQEPGEARAIVRESVVASSGFFTRHLAPEEDEVPCQLVEVPTAAAPAQSSVPLLTPSTMTEPMNETTVCQTVWAETLALAQARDHVRAQVQVHVQGQGQEQERVLQVQGQGQEQVQVQVATPRAPPPSPQVPDQRDAGGQVQPHAAVQAQYHDEDQDQDQDQEQKDPPQDRRDRQDHTCHQHNPTRVFERTAISGVGRDMRRNVSGAGRISTATRTAAKCPRPSALAVVRVRPGSPPSATRPASSMHPRQPSGNSVATKPTRASKAMARTKASANSTKPVNQLPRWR